jgi:hypothetical protein
VVVELVIVVVVLVVELVIVVEVAELILVDLYAKQMLKPLAPIHNTSEVVHIVVSIECNRSHTI